MLEQRDGHWLQVLGRLKPGVNRDQARAALEVLTRQLAKTYPDERDAGVLVDRVVFIPPNVKKAATPIIMLVMGAVGLVLLIACANVANMLLSRAASRQKEIGIRLSLGATRLRLVKQLLTESLLIGLLGGAAVLLLASWISSLLLRVVQPPF